MAQKLYLPKTVDVALRERMAWVFDTFETVVVSVSGGKDSTVLFDAAQREAAARGRQVICFFLDQEAEYQATIDHVRHLMHLGDHVVPQWYQVPIRMTNATSYEDEMLHAWQPGAEWVRAKEPDSIHEAHGAPDRFYDFLTWIEQQYDSEKACFLVGLRSEESLNRYRAVTANPAIEGVPWSSRSKGAVRLYPLYDFSFEDIWTYLGRFKLPYNRAYDWMWSKGGHIQDMRVSNLIHEKAFQSLATLQEFEPATWDALQRRLKGVHAAGIYANEPSVYRALTRPKAYKTWRAYRDFLLDHLPGDRTDTFRARFAKQRETESVFRQQCRQILLNDWENNVAVVQQDDKPNPLLKWMDIL